MKRFFFSASLIGLATAAHAQLFTPGGSFTFVTSDSPGSASDSVTFTVGVPQSIEGGAATMTVEVFNAANFATTGDQWVVLETQTTHGAALSTNGGNWEVSAQGMPVAVPINFIADYSQWQDTTGANIPQMFSIFGQTLMSSPVPGLTGSGEGSSGFSSPAGIGPLFPITAFAHPFGNFVPPGLGVNVGDIGGEYEAVEFSPQSFTPGVPEPGTWALMGVGFGLRALLGFKRTRKDRLAEIA